MKFVMLAVALSAGFAAVSATQSSAPSADWRPKITPVTSPSGSNAAQPQMTVSSRGVLLSWIERAGTRAALKFAERTPKGWSPVITVAEGNDWFVNWADVPSVVRLHDGTLAAHWLQKSGSETYAYDVRLTHSADDGRTWAPSFTPHSDSTKTEHGFASLFQMVGGGLGLVWLDGRGMKTAAGHAGHGADAGAMSVRFGAYDKAWKRTSETLVDGRACDCCPTTAAITSEGPIVAYRDRSDDEVRDIHVARMEHGAWTDGRPVHSDNWKIAACPVNGPMLSARDRSVVLAWFTVKDDIGHAYAAFSSDAGRAFGAPIRLDDTSALGRVDVALLPDGSAQATWIEFADQRSTFATRRVERNGKTSPMMAVTAMAASRASGYPRMAVSNNEIIFAWTANEGQGSSVKVAVSSLGSPSSDR